MRRRQLLGLLGAGTVMPRLSLASSSEQTQRLLVVYSHGGWDVSMLFDPKFSSRQIDTASDGDTRSVGGLDLCRFAESTKCSRFYGSVCQSKHNHQRNRSGFDQPHKV